MEPMGCLFGESSSVNGNYPLYRYVSFFVVYTEWAGVAVFSGSSLLFCACNSLTKKDSSCASLWCDGVFAAFAKRKWKSKQFSEPPYSQRMGDCVCLLVFVSGIWEYHDTHRFVSWCDQSADGRALSFGCFGRNWIGTIVFYSIFSSVSRLKGTEDFFLWEVYGFIKSTFSLSGIVDGKSKIPKDNTWFIKYHALSCIKILAGG